MSRFDRAVMCAEKPTLDQGSQSVDSRQRLVGGNRAAEQDARIMKVAFIRQRHVDRRPVRANSGPERDVLTHKWQERIFGRTLDATQSDSPKPLGIVNLNGHGNRNQMTAVMALGSGSFMS